jgi:hypothetical protein
MDNEKKRGGGLIKWLIIILLILIVVGAIILASFNFTYSEGNRAGIITKFSKKGYVFKTYEGELNVGGLSNIPNVAQANQLWEFSVKEQAIADTLMHLEGRKVSLHYRQISKNMPWQGDTPYFVDGVQLVSQ